MPPTEIVESGRYGSTSGVVLATSLTKPSIDAKPAVVPLATSASSVAEGPALVSHPSQPEWPMSM